VPDCRKDPTVFSRLDAVAQEIPIGCDGLLIQPYWSGVMDPYSDVSAHGLRSARSKRERPFYISFTLELVGPRQYLLRRSGFTCTSRKSHIGCITSHDGGDVNDIVGGKTLAGHGVGNGDSQRSPVVFHMHGEDMPAMEINVPG
jgi:hypothetical protein